MLLASTKRRNTCRPRTASSALGPADGLRVTAIARTELKIRSQSEHAVTHSELECELLHMILMVAAAQLRMDG